MAQAVDGIDDRATAATQAIRGFRRCADSSRDMECSQFRPMRRKTSLVSAKAISISRSTMPMR